MTQSRTSSRPAPVPSINHKGLGQPFLFLGMGIILGGITMTLVNVVRSLRDAGRDVQQSLGAQPVQLDKPLSGKLTPHVMLMGAMVEVGSIRFEGQRVTELARGE